MRFSYSLLLIIFSLSFLPLSAQKGPRELKKDKSGITVYTRDVEGSNLKDLKLKARMKGTLSSVLAAFYDVDTYKDWAYSTTETKALKMVSDLEMYYYTVSDFPWPFQDRDLVVKSILSQDPNTKTVVSESFLESNFYPAQNNRVRVPKFWAKWSMTPTNDGWLDIEYIISTDPGGNVPAWLVYLFIDKGPIHSIKRLQEVINQEPYKSASYSFITE